MSTKSSTVLVPAEHPAFDGHFPGAPLLPGVVLLDEMLQVVENGQPGAWTISTAKFLQPVRPGDTLTLEQEALTNGAIRFAIRSAGRKVATGTLVPTVQKTTEADDGHEAS